MEKLIEIWKTSDKIRPIFKNQLAKFDPKELAAAFSEKPLKFGTAGYRAIVGPGNHYLNEFTYAQLAYAYAQYLKSLHLDSKEELSIVLGTDNRIDHELYLKYVIAVLTQEGFRVYVNENLDPLPTPIVSYLVTKTKSVGAINITASHNPKEYNGIKFYNSYGSQLLPSDDEKLISFIPNQIEMINYNYQSVNEKISIIDNKMVDEYFKDITYYLGLNYNDGSFNKKILFSAMHGASAKYMSKFLNSLGYDCIDYEPHNNHDPNFSNSVCVNPEVMPAFSNGLIEYAEENNIDLIFAADPDADRLGVCFKRKNGEWELLNGNQAGIIECFYILNHRDLENKTPVVISTHVSNTMIDKIVEAFNGKVLRTATGFKWIASLKQKITDDEVYINGYEEAIGALPSVLNNDKDSFQVAGLLLEILKTYSANDYDFIDILEKVIFPKYGYWYGETKSIIISGTDWKEKGQSYIEILKNYNNPNIISRKIDSISYNEEGSCLEFKLNCGSWIKFRLSGTEPKFKIYFNLFAIDNTIPEEEIIESLKEEKCSMFEFISQIIGIE